MKVWIDDVCYDPTSCIAGNFVIAPTAAKSVRVRVEDVKPEGVVTIRPLSMNIAVEKQADSITFTATIPARLSVEFDGDTKHPLLLFLMEEQPYPNEPAYTLFKSGIHNIGVMELKSDDKVYLEKGAVLRGVIFARDADDIEISGPGLFDVTDLLFDGKKRTVIQLLNCRNVVLRDFTIIGAATWNVVPIACKNVLIEGINILSWIMTGDGIDICGCENVTVTGGFFRTADDCIAIKAVDYAFPDGCKNIRDIRVSQCVLWNDEPGNAMEIGYETRADEICGVHFYDIDVIHCMREGWQSGGVFTIHNGDRAKIHDISYRDIRVEDAREKLIDFKILHAVYSKDPQRGEIQNILFENIAIVEGAFPPSIMRGWEDGHHIIGPVAIRNLTYKDEKVHNVLDARIVNEMCSGITVE